MEDRKTLSTVVPPTFSVKPSGTLMFTSSVSVVAVAPVDPISWGREDDSHARSPLATGSRISKRGAVSVNWPAAPLLAAASAMIPRALSVVPAMSIRPPLPDAEPPLARKVPCAMVLPAVAMVVAPVAERTMIWPPLPLTVALASRVALAAISTRVATVEAAWPAMVAADPRRISPPPWPVASRVAVLETMILSPVARILPPACSPSPAETSVMPLIDTVPLTPAAYSTAPNLIEPLASVTLCASTRPLVLITAPTAPAAARAVIRMVPPAAEMVPLLKMPPPVCCAVRSSAMAKLIRPSPAKSSVKALPLPSVMLFSSATISALPASAVVVPLTKLWPFSTRMPASTA